MKCIHHIFEAMNYLAHALLSFSSPDILTGNVITDLIRKKDENHLSFNVLKGVAHHRKIDHFTDNHPLIQSLLKLCYPSHGKYASVFLDVIWDFYLVKNWTNFTNSKSDEFIKESYRSIRFSELDSVTGLANKLKRMIDADFLNSCSTLDRMQRTLVFIDKRTKFTSNFDKGLETLQTHDKAFENGFLEFFPELYEYSFDEMKSLPFEIKANSEHS